MGDAGTGTDMFAGSGSVGGEELTRTGTDGICSARVEHISNRKVPPVCTEKENIAPSCRHHRSLTLSRSV